MLNLDTSHVPDLPPYVPLPENARKAALDSVSKYGFTALEHYDFFSLRENHSLKANILAFAHPIHRTPEYTGLTVFNAINGHNDAEIVSLLATSTAPFHLIHRRDEFSLWVSSIQDKKTGPKPRSVLNHVSYDRLDEALSDFEIDLRPQRIIDVKQGRDNFTFFRDIQPLQLSLWAADVTSKQLVDHFGATVALLRESLLDHNDMQEVEKDSLVTTLSIQLLGAIILADTGVLGEEMRLSRPSLNKLVLKASERFERYFQPDLFIKYSFEAEQAYQVLQRICYAAFIPDMLRELYKKAYGKQERLASGSYDTPLYLTRRIWHNIPVEYLPPSKRVVADMTCGWGSFLVAGYERLANLTDMRNIALRDQLHGNDSASFTAQLAGLGLLLSTSEDSWDIGYSDALQWQWLKNERPNIIVGNPPFSGNRKKTLGDISSLTKKTREEKANKFLEYAIERLAPRGYLAMLMPSSFTAAEASPGYRKYLLEQCDILELWDIPSGVFDAEVQSVVIFAQKKSDLSAHSRYPVRVRTIQRHTIKYTDNPIYTASGLVPDQAAWSELSRKSAGSQNTHIMDFTTILPKYIWQTIQASCEQKCLRDYTTIIRGAIVGQKAENKEWKDYPDPKQVPWLAGVKEVMPPSHPFFLNYGSAATIVYPNDLERPRKSKKNKEQDKEPILAGMKVLVPYDTNPSWGRRLRAVIERKGYYVSDHFYVIIPTSLAEKKHITHEVLAAILNWDVGNAWVVEHLKSAGIPKRIIETIPFPNDLSEEECRLLTEAVHQLEKAADTDQPLPKEAIEIIDFILKRAYHLNNVIFARLRQVREWHDNPQITLDPLYDSNEANWSLSGVVDSINIETNTIRINLSGFNELQTVQIVPSMPGWMLRPDAAFITKIPRKYVKNGTIPNDSIAWGTFYPQHYTYLTEEELFAELATVLHASEKDWA